MPIAYIARTRERYAEYPPFRWAVNTEAPWTPLAKPIKECRLALVSSGGFYLKTQPPFGEDDTSYRKIPWDTNPMDRTATARAPASEPGPTTMMKISAQISESTERVTDITSRPSA